MRALCVLGAALLCGCPVTTPLLFHAKVGACERDGLHSPYAPGQTFTVSMTSTAWELNGVSVSTRDDAVVAVTRQARGDALSKGLTLETRGTGETRLDVWDAAHHLVESHLLKVAAPTRLVILPGGVGPAGSLPVAA